MHWMQSGNGNLLYSPWLDFHILNFYLLLLLVITDTEISVSIAYTHMYSFRTILDVGLIDPVTTRDTTRATIRVGL